MRTLFTYLTGLTLLAATGFLTADVIFGVSTPLSRPSLLLLTASLVVLAIQLRSTRRKLFLRAIDSFVQRESLREMEVELHQEREKHSARSLSDSRPVQKVVS